MKIYILTKTIISDLGGTEEQAPKLFINRKQAKKYMLDDVLNEKRIFNKSLDEYIMSESAGFYSYYYVSDILGFTKILYNIWESEL